MSWYAGRKPNSPVFYDLDAAEEEAEFLANEPRAEGQKRSAYIVQFGSVYRVYMHRPKYMPIARTVRPKSKLRMMR